MRPARVELLILRTECRLYERVLAHIAEIRVSLENQRSLKALELELQNACGSLTALCQPVVLSAAQHVTITEVQGCFLCHVETKEFAKCWKKVTGRHYPHPSVVAEVLCGLARSRIRVACLKCTCRWRASECTSTSAPPWSDWHGQLQASEQHTRLERRLVQSGGELQRLDVLDDHRTACPTAAGARQHTQADGPSAMHTRCGHAVIAC